MKEQGRLEKHSLFVYQKFQIQQTEHTECSYKSILKKIIQEKN